MSRTLSGNPEKKPKLGTFPDTNPAADSSSHSHLLPFSSTPLLPKPFSPQRSASDEAAGSGGRWAARSSLPKARYHPDPEGVAHNTRETPSVPLCVLCGSHPAHPVYPCKLVSSRPACGGDAPTSVRRAHSRNATSLSPPC